MRRRLIACALLVAALAPPAPAEPTAEGTDPWYSLHVFEGMEGCLAVRDGQRLKLGDRVLVFADSAPRMARIAAVLPGDSVRRVFEAKKFEGVYADRKLWKEIGCYWALGMRAVPPPLAIARCDSSEIASPDLSIAIQALPASAVVVGRRDTLSRAELDSLSSHVADSLPEAFARTPLLRAGCRYGSGTHEVIEMFLGRASYNHYNQGAPIDSVDIFRIFLHQGRVLAVQRLSRATGRMEHVDVEPSDLDEQNWFAIPEQTLGFVSLDGGTTWDHLSVDVGFEGIMWAIRRLTGGTPTRWEFYLSTSH